MCHCQLCNLPSDMPQVVRALEARNAELEAEHTRSVMLIALHKAVAEKGQKRIAELEAALREIAARIANEDPMHPRDTINTVDAIARTALAEEMSSPVVYRCACAWKNLNHRNGEDCRTALAGKGE